MEDGRWKKDKTPYLIFQCSKCHQYSYVKITQKTKKCLRCNRTHQVQKLLGKDEIVKGMTAAVESVKMLQNELARNELGRDPDLVSEKGFSLPQKGSIMQVRKFRFIDHDFEEEEDQYPIFLTMLCELNSSYKKFPLYLMNIIADEKGIPHSVLPGLIRKAINEKKLKKLNDLYTYIS
jgi:hypothetical protein